MTNGSTVVQQKFTYNTLPSSNGAFGNKTVTLRVASGALGFPITQTAKVQVFFSRDATNNPGGSAPNWYYYWKQSSANYATHEYFNSPLYSGRSFCGFYDPDGDKKGIYKVYIGPTAKDASGAVYNYAEGIDRFAWTTRHEERHRLDFTELWKNPDGTNRDRNDAEDADPPTTIGGPVGDSLPDAREAMLRSGALPTEHAEGYDPTMKVTHSDHFGYGPSFNDAEDYCLHRQQKWTNGSANHEDWAKPGKQW